MEICEKKLVVERLGDNELKLLIHLIKTGSMKVSDARSLGMGYGTFYRALYTLRDLNLVKEEVIKGVERRIRLNEKGEKVAEKLLEIDRILVEGS